MILQYKETLRARGVQVGIASRRGQAQSFCLWPRCGLKRQLDAVSIRIRFYINTIFGGTPATTAESGVQTHPAAKNTGDEM